MSGLDYGSREVSPLSQDPVIVVGAGPVGSVTAALLGRRGIPVLLLEKGTFPRDKPCGEGLMPGGVAVLKELGIDLAAEGFPRLGGIRYRTVVGDAAFGAFRGSSGVPDHGFGVRRVRFDALLAQRAAATPGVRLEVGCTVSGLTIDSTGVSVETNRGRLRGSFLVGADGLRSGVRQILGWDRPASRKERFGLVGHLTVPGHGLGDVNVTVLDGVEVYVAPSGPDEVLAAVLGRRGELRVEGLGVADSYRCFVTAAHPAFVGAAMTKVTGAGPFGVSARRVAAGRTFLVGDAAGFVDPITGDAMAAGFRAGSRLATLLETGPDAAAAAYARWFAGQWRTRRIVSGLALRLTASPALARRALRGLDRRPGALEGLLAVNSGTSGLGSLSIRDWSALAGV
ncbi:MAG: NAD(P)/FAD-dependent oxidoreductase [Candidatus Dormibacteraceae bacterium]